MGSSRAILLFAAILAFPVVGSAQLYDFEVLVVGTQETELCSGLQSPAPVRAMMDWFERADTESSSESFVSFAAASADGRRVFGLDDRESLPGFDVRLHSGIFVHTVFYSSDDYEPLTITQASDGRLFVVARQGVNASLLVISTTGILEAAHPIPMTTQIAAGPDGCTLYYLNGGSIQRINGCTGAPMTPFASIAGDVRDVYPLPDGSALIVVDNSVQLLNASGAVVRTISMADYGVGGATYPAQVAMGSDRILYVAVAVDCEVNTDGFGLAKIAFDTGTLLSVRGMESTTVNSLVLGSETADIPTASDAALLILALAIAGTGAMVLRLRA